MPDLNILSLDVALANTGYAVFPVRLSSSLDVTTQSHREFSLRTVGIIHTEAKADTDTRVRLILDEFKALVLKHQINYVIIEEPSALFVNRFGKDIIGTIGSLMKVVAACYGVVGYCHHVNLYCRTIYPSSWQRLKKEEKKKSKEVSIRKAEVILNYLKSPIKLNYSTDDHIADAINIGTLAFQNLAKGEWALPTV